VEISSLSNWNDVKKCVRASEPAYKSLNRDLERALAEAKEANDKATEQGNTSLQKIKENVKKADDKEIPTLLRYVSEFRERSSQRLTLGVRRHFGTLEAYLTKFLDQSRRYTRNTLISEVSADFLDSFSSYIRRNPIGKSKGTNEYLHPNTTATIMKKFRTIIRDAIFCPNHYIKVEENPFGSENFGKYQITTEKTHREALTKSEMEELENLVLEVGSWEDKARDSFFFSFYCGGIRVGDFLQLRWQDLNEEAGQLQYRMNKNNKLSEVIFLTPKALQIIDKYDVEGHKPTDYIFPFLDSNSDWAKASTKGREMMSEELEKTLFSQIASNTTMLNKALKILAKMAGITKNLSFHIARHTFANLASESGVATRQIQKILRHSDLATTETYLDDFSNEDTRKAMDMIFSGNNSKQALISEFSVLSEEDMEMALDWLKTQRNGQ
jgi:integrase/recombinase XerD